MGVVKVERHLTSDSLLQLWNDDYDIKSATDRNIHLILSPCSYTYFDPYDAVADSSGDLLENYAMNQSLAAPTPSSSGSRANVVLSPPE